MGGEVASGLFAIGGAFVGGLASYVATAVQVRGQRNTANDARLAQLAETRRLLYGSLLECTDVLMDAARDIHDFNAREDVTEASRSRYNTAWDNFVQAGAAVEIIGPIETADTARQMGDAVAAVCNEVDSWLIDGKRWDDAKEAKYQQERAARRTCKEAFVKTARGVLNTG